MLALLEDYQQMLKAENLLEDYPRVEHSHATYTGNESCVRCHSLSTYRYRNDKHAHAFDVIAARKEEYDPECVQCHTVGFGYKSGFISIDKTPNLVDVGCEDCHGPGSKHVENPLEDVLVRRRVHIANLRAIGRKAAVGGLSRHPDYIPREPRPGRNVRRGDHPARTELTPRRDRI